MAMATSEVFHPHFVLVPFLSQGHLIPMVEFALILAQHGSTVTLVTTPLNAIQHDSIIDQAPKSGLPVRLFGIEFPALEAGVPNGCESLDTLPSKSLIANFFTALSLLQKPFEEMLLKLSPAPSCIISDKLLAWTTDTAIKFNIPKLLFDGMCCFSSLCFEYLHASKIYEQVAEAERFVLPCFPGEQIELTRAQLPEAFNPHEVDMEFIHRRIREGEVRAYGLVFNSFEELEPVYFEDCRKLKGDKAWCIGPLALCNKGFERAHRSKATSMDQMHCLQWLGSWPQGSVVYACFGSMSHFTTAQMIELGLGLEASTRPFIWVIRGNGSEGLREWVKDEAFEERVKERGLLIWDWVSQVVILSHTAVGCFLTHCGWNSALEAVCGGVPMVTWPLFAEQFLNEKLIVDVLRIGVKVGVEVAVPWGEQERFGILVKRDDVKRAIQELMGNGEEANERRKRVHELQEMAKCAVQGSSFNNVEMLIEDIRQLALASEAENMSKCFN